jgi:hypothetical protein
MLWKAGSLLSDNALFLVIRIDITLDAIKI